MSAITPVQLVNVAIGFVNAARDPADGGADDAMLLDSMSESRFVAAMYNAFHGVNGDIPGVQFWADEARNHGRSQMVIDFLTNGEYPTKALAVKGNG